MQIKTVSLGLLLMVSGIMPGCDEPYCTSRFLDVEGISLVANTSSTQPVVTNATVYSLALQLKCTLQTRGYGVQLPQGGFRTFADCKPPDYTEWGDSVVVTSRFDYDLQHPAGASLNDLLDLEARLTNVQQFHPVDLDQNTFRFLQRPATSGPQQFRVYYRQTNGEVYTAETVVMNLLR
ncbi:hypothetical protein [Hymenobacter sp. APR13]|uniref:hypothetical protein n=1 Tax=Hymenobacter sp. APR13 TaxID=1356852 RepID=UPI0004E06DA3|nr:hypothetical protein [Hymenobacter sp. APR13]AII51173.1 hypothetical protein N008_04155 [Hymenobacter sp. APR13]